MSTPRLMYVTDRKSASQPLPVLATLAIAGGVDVVQVREKGLGTVELEKLVSEILERVGDPAQIAVNGAPEIAERLGVGLHLPESTSWPAARSERVTALSRSVHSAEGAAASAGADYVIAGHVFQTGSKPGLPSIGIEGFESIVRASSAPVIAIGGVTVDRIPELIASGAGGVAVLSGINCAADPATAAHNLKHALETAMEQTETTAPVTVNGKPAAITPGITIDAFLRERNHHERMVVVELNGVIIRRAGFSTTTLNEGDKIEIVHFVGGG